MAYAAKIIDHLGGSRALARQMAYKPSTVQSWKDSGFIPARHQQSVLDAAVAMGKALSPADFFDPQPENGSAPPEQQRASS